MSEEKKKIKNVYKSNSKIIVDKRRLMDQARGNLEKMAGKTVCECQHLDKSGEPAIRVTKVDGEQLIMCKLCGKKIDLKAKSDSEIDTAIATVDNMCDIIKMCLNINDDRDMDAYKKVAKIQYRVNYQLKKLYNQARSKKGNKKKNNNNNGLGSGFGSPVSR